MIDLRGDKCKGFHSLHPKEIYFLNTHFSWARVKRYT